MEYINRAYSQDAYDKLTENDKAASLRASGGVYGGGQRGARYLLYSETVGALCYDDYKGAGQQYVGQGKLVVYERLDKHRNIPLHNRTRKDDATESKGL